MKKLLPILLIFSLLLAACATEKSTNQNKEYKIGILLSDTGLGDESFNDSAFRGLEKARGELGILFDYKEAPDGNFEKPLEELVKENNDLVIGLGFSAQEALEKTAKKYPDQQFLLIDAVSELDNVVSLTFKEHEGSFLVGMLAAMTSKTDKLGFIGGVDVSVIHHFENGFVQGAKHFNPKIEILTAYAGTFGDAALGEKMAEKQIAEGADFIYPAAGFTGFGALKKAEEKGVLAGGVDSDQYFVAENAVAASMLKNIDVAVFNMAKELTEKGKIEASSYVLGLAENGVGLSEIRVISLTEEQKAALKKATEDIIAGKITVKSE
ncbi:ABC transporter substrate-binding protein [Sporosarcina globispora]|uniref:ABC transporter substrate-binding protein n=1 Tax=Sporosarcina globispora TaxID=1459 RepID=A0A0M0G8X7_SPOGL|nr:BMP family ABC transporter substrate-binding protein [Sporosarcina globispora]KON86299.1 ABC transporter substrate-binding protein [Sporosarcina globispora]